MALASTAGAGSSGIGCAASRIYTRYTWSVKGAASSGLLVAWAVALGFNYRNWLKDKLFWLFHGFFSTAFHHGVTQALFLLMNVLIGEP